MNEKKLAVFEKSLIWLCNFCTKQCYHLKESVFVEYLEATVWKTDRKMLVAESILKNWTFTKNGVKSQAFPCIFSKSLQKTSNCCSKRPSFQVWKEKQRKKQTYEEVVFFSFFFKFIYKWLLQHNISTVKKCITYLSVLIGGVFRSSSKI